MTYEKIFFFTKFSQNEIKLNIIKPFSNANNYNYQLLKYLVVRNSTEKSFTCLIAYFYTHTEKL